MLAKLPAKLENLSSKNLNREVLRIGMIAELDAVNLYEQLAAMTDNKKIEAVFLDIAREEKTHVGEFQALLLGIDKEQSEALEQGRKEVEEIHE